MASPIITPLPVQTETDYRPVSKLAVSGFLLAIPAVFIFFSENLYWLLIVPILPAIIICIVAWRSIRNSDGNLAGEPVAMLGLVVAVGCGLGWITMMTVTRFVNESEARTTVDEWLGKLSKKEFGAAYLYTKPPSARRLTFNPEEYGRLRRQFPHDQFVSDFDNFLIEPVTNLFMRYGDQVKVNYSGLIDSRMLKGETANFRFRYTITCPSLEGSFVVNANSSFSNTDEGIRRDWDVTIDRNSLMIRETNYGSEFTFVKNKAQDSLEKMIVGIANDEEEDYAKLLDKNALGDFSLILGYIRDKDRKGPLLEISLQKPFRLFRDQKEGDSWTLGIECTTFIEGSRGVDFACTALSKDKGNTWVFRDFKFQGIRRIKQATGPMTSSGPGVPDIIDPAMNRK